MFTIDCFLWVSFLLGDTTLIIWLVGCGIVSKLRSTKSSVIDGESRNGNAINARNTRNGDISSSLDILVNAIPQSRCHVKYMLMANLSIQDMQ